MKESLKDYLDRISSEPLSEDLDQDTEDALSIEKYSEGYEEGFKDGRIVFAGQILAKFFKED